MYEAALTAYEADRGAGSADLLGAQAKQVSLSLSLSLSVSLCLMNLTTCHYLSIQRLRLAVDQIKIDLSSADSVTLSVDMGALFGYRR